jgi:hypothetical protein
MPRSEYLQEDLAVTVTAPQAERPRGNAKELPLDLSGNRLAAFAAR